jgi:hypothetical protein
LHHYGGNPCNAFPYLKYVIVEIIGLVISRLAAAANRETFCLIKQSGTVNPLEHCDALPTLQLLVRTFVDLRPVRRINYS